MRPLSPLPKEMPIVCPQRPRIFSTHPWCFWRLPVSPPTKCGKNCAPADAEGPALLR